MGSAPLPAAGWERYRRAEVVPDLHQQIGMAAACGDARKEGQKLQRIFRKCLVLAMAAAFWVAGIQLHSFVLAPTRPQVAQQTMLASSKVQELEEAYAASGTIGAARRQVEFLRKAALEACLAAVKDDTEAVERCAALSRQLAEAEASLAEAALL
uniref:Uncharacterized protein n=1 Tax=Pyrodinium bahamense TaxID=73915 RepID=A0A7R9ZZX4_9DINO